MPLDPLSPFSPGDPGPLPASTWNRLLEMLRRDLGQRLGNSGGGFLPDALGPTATVLVRNDTGSAASHGYCLALTDALLDPTASPPDWLNRPAFAGDEPAATTDAFCVLLEPLAVDAVGRAAIAGLAYAQVNVTNLAHEYATPTAADATKLTSAVSGPARILWQESGSTGTQACVLHLGGGATPGGAGFSGVARTFTGASPGRTSITGGGGFTRVNAGNATSYEVGTYVSGSSIVIPANGYYLLQMQAFLTTGHTVVVATSPPLGVQVALGDYDGAGPTVIYFQDIVIPPGSTRGRFNLSATHYIAAATILYPYLVTDDTSGSPFDVDLEEFRLEVTKVG